MKFLALLAKLVKSDRTAVAKAVKRLEKEELVYIFK